MCIPERTQFFHDYAATLHVGLITLITEGAELKISSYKYNLAFSNLVQWMELVVGQTTAAMRQPIGLREGTTAEVGTHHQALKWTISPNSRISFLSTK